MHSLEPLSRSAFRQNPAGGFVAGDNWAYFAFDLTLFGYAIWGRPSSEDIRALVRLLEVELDRPLHSAIVDLGDLELVDPQAFEALASYTVKHEKLGLAPRSMQRRLSEHGTSFEAEVQTARLKAAERRLDETETPITTIALDLGFATPQHFATLFRKHTGLTPTEFRARRRRG